MKSIHTLIKDIYSVIGKDGWLNEAVAENLGRDIGRTLLEATGPRTKVPRLRLSAMGEKCPCQLWHSIHTPLAAEPLPAWVRIKLTYGHILETYVIAMAKAAGHEVTGEQDEVVVDGVKGHRDCVIDGCIVDIKSLNSRGFERVKAKEVADDVFLRDYLAQLDGYAIGSAMDDLVSVKDKAYILAIDKVLGHLTLYEHKIRPGFVEKRIDAYKRIVQQPDVPTCTCGTVDDGRSGNVRLDLKASYNPFKYSCKPNLRTFLYANGPVYLTKVVRKPDVMEIDRYGKIVYNY